MKKLARGFCIFLSVALALLLCACFSYWTGTDANLTIVWGDAGHSRFVSENDLNGYSYSITLSGPGETIRETFDKNGVYSASYTVKPGTWSVVVKGHQGAVLKVMAIEQVQIYPGQNSNVSTSLYTATEVTDWNGLRDAVAPPSGYNSSQNRIEMVVIKGLFTTGTSGITISRPIILVAEGNVTISRSNNNSDPFFTVGENTLTGTTYSSVGDLTLGKDGMAGTLTFDGMRSTSNNSEPLIRLEQGKLVMNNGVSIQNNYSSGNLINAGGGGGVYLTNAVGTRVFEMNGGVISGNKALYGAGVSVGGYYSLASYGNGCTFIMNGGTIKNNTASNSGGGVYVGGVAPALYGGGRGTFTHRGGTISGNSPNDVNK